MPTFDVFKGQKDGVPKKSTTTKPEPTGDQVLVRITASGVCGTGKFYYHRSSTPRLTISLV
jgi:D-arabinose 1-dehydrogenase-like Zn-dependent alcohol dehydrogenase